MNAANARPAGLTIRAAGLDDVAGIHEVHRSDVKQWRRLDGSPGEFARLTVLERYLNGGPWMSPESCAAYVNELILAGTPPLIAVDDGRVLGEMELLYGPDRPDLGQTVCLSILYVHRDARGLGVGRALVGEAVRRGRSLGYRSIETTDPEPEAIPFYVKEGFAPAGEMTTTTVLLNADGSRPGWAGTQEIAPLPALETLRPDDQLVVGRTRHPALVKQMLRHAAGSGRLAIPGTGGLVRAFAIPVSGSIHVAFFRGTPLRANGLASPHVFGRSLNGELINALLAVATQAGYGSLALTVGAGDTGMIEAAGTSKSHQVWVRYL